MALIFWGSALTGGDTDELARRASGVEEPVEIQRIKDVAHVTEYGLLAVLLVRAFTGRSYTPSRSQMLWSFAIAALYGVTDELHQYFIPQRYPGMDDIIRNTVGAGLGVLLVRGITYIRNARL
jgi:VanZ family protein